MQTKKSALIYISILLVLIILSLVVTYYRYMVQQNFTYFQTEDQIPNHFDISSYSKL